MYTHGSTIGNVYNSMEGVFSGYVSADLWHKDNRDRRVLEHNVE